jgi:hypothetical protein
MLRLTSRASELFLQQPAAEQRRLINVVIHKAAWKDGVLQTTLLEPFEILRHSNQESARNEKSNCGSGKDLKIWLPRKRGFQLPLRPSGHDQGLNTRPSTGDFGILIRQVWHLVSAYPVTNGYSDSSEARIGEETLSSTRASNLSHTATFQLLGPARFEFHGRGFERVIGPQASAIRRSTLTRGSNQYHPMDSSNAMLYTRRVIGEDTLSSTSVYRRCHSASFSTIIKSFILGPVVGP